MKALEVLNKVVDVVLKYRPPKKKVKQNKRNRKKTKQLDVVVKQHFTIVAKCCKVGVEIPPRAIQATTWTQVYGHRKSHLRRGFFYLQVHEHPSLMQRAGIAAQVVTHFLDAPKDVTKITFLNWGENPVKAVFRVSFPQYTTYVDSYVCSWVL